MFNIRTHYCLDNVLQRLNDFNYKVGENKPKQGKHIGGFKIWEQKVSEIKIILEIIYYMK